MQSKQLVLVLLVTSVGCNVTPKAPSDVTSRKDIEPSSSELADSKNVQEETLTETDADVITKVSSSPQHIAESEELKTNTELADEDVDSLLDIPIGLFEVTDVDSVDTHKRQNYASLDAGATILDAAPETKSPTNLLVPDKDRYMLMPCSSPRKWVVISLSEDVRKAVESKSSYHDRTDDVHVHVTKVYADAIAVANYEKFSSLVKDFVVLGGVNYPTDTWLVLGNFTAAHKNGEQIFQLDAQQHVRYIKLRFLSHYGSEYYCTLSQLRVFGRTFTQVISQLEKSIDTEVEAAFSIPQASIPSESTEVSVPGTRNLTEIMSPCLMEKSNSVVTAFYNKSQQIEHDRRHGMCCEVNHAPEQLKVEATPNSNTNEHVLTPSSDLYDSDIGNDVTQQMDSSTLSANASSTSIVSSSGSNTTQPSNGAAASSTGHSSVPSTQGLGRLESIFNEMLILREVITTMKAGILCAILLSGVIISFYLLCLLFRCVSKCKARADLRECFWRMEKHGFSVNDTGKTAAWDRMKAGVLRVNRKALFGSSWDDAAIERKPLVRDKVVNSPAKAPTASHQAVK
ncbi:hypothetical protein PsorP6_003307 [Peronosclerospora sorghi]|uniref:Uncharacterized protein n=1 Tax=Peronosclerospora sorghi TaxID=230839 RepID=A0ACC0VLE0_9STRA|nr:hypothetical protein PsorP6_003307 [Peronosclerospora sorghi]